MDRKEKAPDRFWRRLFLALLVPGLLYLGFLGFFLLHGVTADSESNDLGEYEAYLAKAEGAEAFLPGPADFGPYQNGTLCARCRRGVFSYSSVMLFLNYSADGFESAQERIESAYPFLDAPGEELRAVSGACFGYSVRAVDLGLRGPDEAKTLLLIGVNERYRSVFYAYLRDTRPDGVDDLSAVLSERFCFPREYR